MLLLLLPDVFRLGHLVLVRHATCPYDGALIHDERETVGVDPSPTGSRLPPEQAALSAPHHHEERCGLSSGAHRAVATLRFEQSLVATVSPPPDPLVAAREEPSVRGVLSYAPKISPPARAQARTVA
ncbi:MAG TPA: hypothetical protein VFQ35_10760 [Polyangiaceae bacterium]|nr:hypothetical protein [Polyangiaceae bacterium]